MADEAMKEGASGSTADREEGAHRRHIDRDDLAKATRAKAEGKDIHKIAQDTSDEDSDKEVRPPFGAGCWGAGQPLKVKSAGKTRSFTDGAGLCSPGRWAPGERKPEQSGLGEAISGSVMRFILTNWDVKAMFYTMAKNSEDKDEVIFPEADMTKLREIVWENLRRYDAAPGFENIAEGQPCFLAAIGEALRICGDPDWKIFAKKTESFSSGVRIGYLTAMPRTPAVYERKTRWK